MVNANDESQGVGMDSLGEIYERAVIERYGFPSGWVANWPLAKDVRLGYVGTVHRPGFSKDGELANYDLGASTQPASGQLVDGWAVKTSDATKVEFGTDAKAPGWHFLKGAKAGVKVEFGDEEAMVLQVGPARFETLSGLDQLRADLLAAGKKGKIGLGKSIIIERFFAEGGVVIGSHGHAGTVTATTKADLGVTGLPALASFAVDGQFQAAKSALTYETYPHGFCVAFRSIRLGQRGWFFWRHMTVFGVTALPEDAHLALDEPGIGEDQAFFVKFPDES